MPYSNLKELPKPVRDNLPHHAQEIFLEAFNNAQREYVDPEKRRISDTAEEVAHKVAWHAVKQKYEKNDKGRWVERDDI